jgi:hypothetical protein
VLRPRSAFALVRGLKTTHQRGGLWPGEGHIPFHRGFPLSHLLKEANVRKFLTTGLVCVAVLAGARPAGADFVWVEQSPGAGPLPSTAQQVYGAGPLTGIKGDLTVSSNLVDLYLISLTGGAFSATTVGQPGTLADSELFLFDNFGRGVAFNDDFSTTDHRSQLTLSGLAPGDYYLGIAFFDVQPTAAGGVNIFGPNAGNRTSILSAQTNSPVTGYLNGPGGLPASGIYTYEIAITGAVATPEPSSLVLCCLGGGGLLFSYWRRRRLGDFSVAPAAR